MASVPAKRVDGRKRSLLLPPCVAFLLIALEFFAIHPASGFLGGLFYLLFGSWVIPSAVNIILSVWVASLFRIHWALRLLIGVSVSFLLGVNTSLPVLLNLDGLPPAEVVVTRASPVTHSLAVDTRVRITNAGNSDKQTLSPPGVHVSSDEGCGCMYWVSDSATYPDQIQKLINERKFSDVADQYQFSDQLPNVVPYNKIVHFAISFAPSSVQRKGLLDMTIDVYQGYDKVASYRQRELPIEMQGPLGRDSKLLNGHFRANVWGILIHHNFWAAILPEYLQHPDYVAPFKDFLARALPPAAANEISSAGRGSVEMPITAMPMKVTQPPSDPNAIIKTMKIATEKGAAVDWVTVSTHPYLVGRACTSGKDSNGTANASLEDQNVAANREQDGSFEARIRTDPPLQLVQGCQWNLDVTVKFYSKGAVVGDAFVGEDLLRGSGVYEGTCISERVDYAGPKPNYPPLCMRKGLNAAEDQDRERLVRSFAWNHVFDTRVEFEP